MPAEVPHSRCKGSPLNSATPPPNRAQTASPAASQIRGMVTTDCHPVGVAAASPPPAPVVGASTRVSRLHTRYILRAAPGAARLYLWPDPWQARTTTDGGRRYATRSLLIRRLRWRARRTIDGSVSMESKGLLRGKAAIITGGEGSIGLATARAFVAE